MKTGNNDRPSQAQEQNNKAIEAMKKIASGATEVRLAERTGKNSLGKDMTEDFDLSRIHEVLNATRGLQGKSFDRSVPFKREVLQEVTQSMVEKGLPPSSQVISPPIPDRSRREEAKP